MENRKKEKLISPRVVIADDHDLFREILTLTLREASFNVVFAATSGREAIDAVLEGKKPEKGENPFAKKKDVKESEESPYPSLDKKKREKKGSNLEDAGGPAAKLKGESVQ